MKVRIEIDCSPEEARAFFGLPDMSGLQETAIAAMQERVKDALKTMDPDALLKTWMPFGMEGLENAQKAFFSAMEGIGRKPGKGAGEAGGAAPGEKGRDKR